ncbi:MAG TPA: efflux RND transporter permease subunit [Candidatus Deferrimicrobium sp.]|nr:efflux RND transporter permease subunit [Candidatus Deferrimicrobium sp.]
MKIVEYSLKNRVTVTMVVVVLIIFGLITFNRLGLDMLPDMEAPYISVITTYSGVASEDIEQNVTRPLEQWVSTVSGVKDIKSISQEGMSALMVEFESGTNLDFAAQDIRDKIGMFEQLLPEGASNPMVIKFNFADMPIMMYGITGGKRDLKALKNYIDTEVATRLERIDGVASAIVVSPEEAEILVNVDKGKLEARGLSIRQVEGAIQASNINLPSGYLTENHKEYLIRTLGQFETVGEIKDIVVGAGQRGEPIFLRDIAGVVETAKEVRNLVRINGTKGVMMIITKSSGANTVLVADAVKEMLAKIKPTLDKDLSFNVALDFSRIIKIMASQSSDDILYGGILAMLLILLFLRNIRPTLAIGITIPLSILTSFIALYMVNYTLNLITIGGLALGVGMLVDNAVVVIESIYRHLEEGKAPREAASIGTSEVGLAISGSTLTTIAVFFPMMFATGVSGTFSRGLAVSVSIPLLASLFIALTIIPLLASWLFSVGKKEKPGQLAYVTLGSQQFMKFQNFYKQLLIKSLKKRKTVLLSVLLVFILSVIIAFLLGAEFMPKSDSAMIFIKLKMPVGTSLEETDRVMKQVEAQSLKDKHVLSTMVSIGLNEENAHDSASGFNPAGSYEGIVWSYLTTKSQRNISDQEILEQWRQYFPELKEGKMQFIDIASMSMMGNTSSSPIELNIFGKDLKKLKEIAARVRSDIVTVPGIRDVEISLQESKPEIELRIKKEEASKLGLTPYDISRQVQTFTIGTVVSRIMLGGEEKDIRVRLSLQDRNNTEALKKLPIVTPQGAKVYLSQVADFQQAFGAVKIDRENQVRKVSVTANYISRDLKDIINDISKRIAAITDTLPEGYFTQIGGAYKDMQESYKTMAFALLLSLVLVYAVMASQFESFKYPFIIMFTIPLGLIGVVFSLLISGKNISLPAIMGFIMLGGIVVNNGIVMVDYINQLIGRGINKFDAVVDGAAVRLRPVLITSLTTIIGMFPMAISSSEGSEMRSPMAIALMGGLTAATFLTLFIVPIIYSYFAKINPKKEINKSK